MAHAIHNAVLCRGPGQVCEERAVALWVRRPLGSGPAGWQLLWRHSGEPGAAFGLRLDVVVWEPLGVPAGRESAADAASGTASYTGETEAGLVFQDARIAVAGTTHNSYGEF